MKILTRIRDTRLSRGYSPTMQELADELGVSKVTVFEHVEALIKKGCLIRDANKARSLVLAPDLELPDEQRHTRLPLVGSIAAGSPIEAVEEREHLDLEELFVPGRKRGATANIFVLRVRGDSMKDDGILDGDFVICEKRNRVLNGQTVVALVANDEATLKRFYREKDGRIRLQPANASYEPLICDADDVQIQGAAIGIVRTF